MIAFIRKLLPWLLAVLAGAGLTWALLVSGLLPAPQGGHGHADTGGEAHGHAGKTGDDHAASAGSGSATAGHDDDEGLIRLGEAQLKAGGLGLETAVAGAFAASLSLPGQLVLDGDREARVAAPVTGRVTALPVRVGDRVRAGDVLAVVESPALADAAGRYLAAREREALAQSTFTREEGLWQQRISAEQDFLSARRELGEARIETRSALQSLRALGVSEREARALAAGDRPASQVLRSPVAGTVLSRDTVLGDTVTPDRVLFRVADLGSLWVDLAVPADSLAGVKSGQTVQISADGGGRGEGRVLFVQPELDAASRSGSVRVVLGNAGGQWRAGQFVRARLVQETGEAAGGTVLSVPQSSIQTVDGRPVVFVAGDDGIRARPVLTGRRDGDRREIVSGLDAGERYVTGNVFVLKAELGKEGAEHAH